MADGVGVADEDACGPRPPGCGAVGDGADRGRRARVEPVAGSAVRSGAPGVVRECEVGPPRRVVVPVRGRPHALMTADERVDGKTGGRTREVPTSRRVAPAPDLGPDRCRSGDLAGFARWAGIGVLGGLARHAWRTRRWSYSSNARLISSIIAPTEWKCWSSSVVR